jgi:WXG100 family type VII secretion target
MNEIGVNTQTLNTQTDSMQRELTLIQSEMGKMYEAVNTLDSMWDGIASMTFKAQFNNDKQKMEDLCKTIQSIIDSMVFAKKEYDTCEANIDSIITAIRV